MAEANFTVSRRIHRVFHRLGVVLGGILVACGIVISGNYAVTWFHGPGPYFLPVYPASKQYSGSVEPLTDKEQAELQLEIKQVRALTDAKHRRRLHEIGAWAAVFIGAGIALYIVLRAIGWIVAGGARN